MRLKLTFATLSSKKPGLKIDERMAKPRQCGKILQTRREEV